MKKLKFMLAAATALGLATASQAYNGSVNFEGANPLTDGYFQFTGTEGDNESELVEETYTPQHLVRLWSNSTHNRHLKVSTGTDPLLRKIESSAIDIPSGGIYIDTLVQFTVTPASDTVTASATDKLMIYLKESVVNAELGTTETNLVVKAALRSAEEGEFGEEGSETFTPTEVEVSSAVVPGQWYRLTVKSYVVDTDLLLFNIWLDGAPLTTGSTVLYGDDTSVFPSLLGRTNAQIAAVGFAGEGAVDDIAFTTDDPFVAALDFTLTLGQNVSSVAFTIDGQDYTAAATATYAVYPGSTITLGQIAYAEGYMAGTAPVATGLTLADGTYTVGEDAATLALSAAALPTVTTDDIATATYANGVYTFAVPAGYVIGTLTVDGTAVAEAAGQTSYAWNAVSGSTVAVTAAQLVAQILGGESYTSFKDAVNAAVAGDVVEVLANCTVAEPITFSAGITVTNNYTVTMTAAYALRFANGTAAPVMFGGTGTFVGNGTGSPFLVGNNEATAKQANYGISGVYAGSLVIDGIKSDFKKTGNAVKLESGTFTLQSGTLTGGTRGVKADTENGDTTAVITINGGVITNASNAAVAATTAGNGSSIITINGGEISGVISQGDSTTITIPGTSTAKFSADQSAYCESGYETVLSDGWYVVQATAPSGEDVEPGQQSATTYATQAAAEAALANVTIAASEAVTNALDETAEAAYLAKFEKKVVGADGVYKIEVGLTAAATAALQTEVDTDAAEVIEDLDSTTVTLTTTPGFYYSFEYGTTLDNMAEVGTRTLATGTTLTLDRPTTTGATAGFYKVLVNIVPSAPAAAQD